MRRRLTFSMVWRLLVFLGSIIGIMRLSVGRWDLWNVWAYAGIYAAGMVVGTVVVYRTDPTLFAERVRPGPGGKDPKLRWLAIPLMLGHVVLAGLDVGRLHWSDRVPLVAQLLGLLALASGMGMSSWAMSANRFFSSDARIQRERGHCVVAGGPYRYVRHPGYLGALLMSVGSPPALGSYISGLPMLVMAGLIFRRLFIEEEMLLAELQGYREYAARVRYRLLPWIW